MSGGAVEWPPDPSGNNDNAKALYAAQLAVVQKRVDAEIGQAKDRLTADTARASAEHAAEIAGKTAYETAVLEVGKGGLDRARSNVELVQKAATAIMALYTGALALVFSVADHPLPLRGIMPAIFLGAAIAGSTAYLAFIGKTDPVAPPEAESDRDLANARLITFITWTRAPTLRRSYWLRFSSVALGLSLAFMPAPFVTGRSAAPAASAPTTGWPTPPTVANDYTKTLYDAQVKEASERRQAELTAAATTAAATRDQTGTIWWVAFGVAALACVLVPLLGAGRNDPPVRDEIPGLPIR